MGRVSQASQACGYSCVESGRGGTRIACGAGTRVAGPALIGGRAGRGEEGSKAGTAVLGGEWGLGSTRRRVGRRLIGLGGRGVGSRHPGADGDDGPWTAGSTDSCRTRRLVCWELGLEKIAIARPLDDEAGWPGVIRARTCPARLVPCLQGAASVKELRARFRLERSWSRAPVNVRTDGRL